MKKNIEKGFTLVELVVVVVVIAIISAIAVPSIIRSRAAANTAGAISAIRVISQVQNGRNIAYRNYLTLGEMARDGSIDDRFAGDTPTATEATSQGFDFKVIFFLAPDGVTTENYLLSAKPSSSYSGTKKCGIDKASVIYCSTENIDQHFSTSEELHAAHPLGDEQ